MWNYEFCQLNSNEFSLFDSEPEEVNFPNFICSGITNNFELAEDSQLPLNNEQKLSFDTFNQKNDENEQKELKIEQFLDIMKSKDNQEKSFLSHKRNLSFENSDIIENDINDIKYSKKDTKESTNKVILKKNKFNCSKIPVIEYRNDYHIKKFKKDCFSNYMTKKLNKYLKDCQFPKKIKIYKPNCNAFTSIANLNKNLSFLSMTLKEIFSLDDNKEGNLQNKNKELFKKIFESKKVKNNQNYEKLKELLNLTVEDTIKEYYVSEEFKEFCKNEEITNYDKSFFKEKKFSMSKEYGFLKLLKAQY